MNRTMAKNLLVSIAASAIILALLPAPRAQGHFEGAGPLGGRGTAIIDGRLSPDEWRAAGSVDFSVQIGEGATTPGRLYVQNDDMNLYFALTIDARGVPTSTTFSSFVIEFDNDHSGGPRAEGDDVFVVNPPGDFFDDYRTYLPPCPPNALCGLFDIDGGGTNDGRAVVIRTAEEVVYEVSKPLDSTDDAHDFSLRAGDVVGFGMMLIVFTPTSGVQTNYPPTVMADLRIVGPTPADTTAPTIASSVSPAPNAAGWNNAPTTVSWTVTDVESGIAASSGCGPTVITDDTAATTVTCSATNGAGLSNSASATVRLDTTPPLITLVGNTGAYDVDDIVHIDCAATDALSGLATSADCGDISGPAYTFPIGDSTYERSAIDLAGNTGTVSTTLSVFVTAGGLCDLTTAFVSNQGVATSLCKKLESGAYHAFRSELNALRGHAIAPQEAEILSALSSAL